MGMRRNKDMGAHNHPPGVEILGCPGCIQFEFERYMGTAEQPAPVPNLSPIIWDLVIEDMQERDRVGRERYGTPLQAHNGRDPLIDAYQEALDLVVYLRQAIEERKR